MTEDEVNEILKGKYPSKIHCRKVYKQLKEQDGDKHFGSPTILHVAGQVTRLIEDCDQAVPFRQRRSFLYMTGCQLPDCELLYDCIDDELILFIPDFEPDEVMWSGLPLTREQALGQYDIDKCEFKSKLTGSIEEMIKRHQGCNHDRQPYLGITHNTNPLPLPLLDHVKTKDIRQAVDASRVIKTSYEVALLRKANLITAAAHAAAIRATATATSEAEIEAAYVQECISLGNRTQGYDSIFASSTEAATLHYTQNNRQLTSSDLNILIDAGAEHRGYTADVTRTIPLTGRFDLHSSKIHEIVQAMQETSFSLLRAQVRWEDLQLEAHKVLIRGLLEIGILHNGTVEQILAARTSAAFFPHGLGHYLGLDTHDVGGQPDYTDRDPFFKYLRLRGRVPAGSVVTVEPGCYFCPFIIDPYLEREPHCSFIHTATLKEYYKVGGVRIEDNCLVTADGYENLTTTIKGAAAFTDLMGVKA